MNDPSNNGSSGGMNFTDSASAQGQSPYYLNFKDALAALAVDPDTVKHSRESLIAAINDAQGEETLAPVKKTLLTIVDHISVVEFSNKFTLLLSDPLNIAAVARRVKREADNPALGEQKTDSGEGVQPPQSSPPEQSRVQGGKQDYKKYVLPLLLAGPLGLGYVYLKEKRKDPASRASKLKKRHALGAVALLGGVYLLGNGIRDWHDVTPSERQAAADETALKQHKEKSAAFPTQAVERVLDTRMAISSEVFRESEAGGVYGSVNLNRQPGYQSQAVVSISDISNPIRQQGRVCYRAVISFSLVSSEGRYVAGSQSEMDQKRLRGTQLCLKKPISLG